MDVHIAQLQQKDIVHFAHALHITAPLAVRLDMHTRTWIYKTMYKETVNILTEHAHLDMFIAAS